MVWRSLAGVRVRLDAATGAVALKEKIEAAGGTADIGKDPITGDEGGQERRRDRRCPRRAYPRRGERRALPGLGRRHGRRGRPHRDRRRRGAGGFPRRGGRPAGGLVPDDLGIRAERRDRPLSGDPRHRPHGPARRAVPDRFRGAISGRHHRHHPHGRGGRAERGDARPLHPGPAGPRRHRPGRVPDGHDRRPDRRLRPGAALARRASTSITAPATASAPSCRCTRGRSGSPRPARWRWSPA